MIAILGVKVCCVKSEKPGRQNRRLLILTNKKKKRAGEYFINNSHINYTDNVGKINQENKFLFGTRERFGDGNNKQRHEYYSKTK